MRKYNVSEAKCGVLVVEAKDSGEAKRAAAKVWKEQGRFTGKADTWIHNHDLKVECMEGQPAKAPASKSKALGKGIATPKAAPLDVTIPKSAPPVDVVIGWALFYIDAGIKAIIGATQDGK